MTITQLQAELSKYRSKEKSATAPVAKDMFKRLGDKIQAEIDGRKK